MSKSIVKNTTLTLLANLSLAASNWLVLVIIAKEYSMNYLGFFVLALSVCSPAFLFASFKVRTLLVVDSKWEFTLEEYAGARLYANLIVTIIIVLAVLLGWIALPVWIISIVILYKWADTCSEFCQSYFRRFHQFNKASYSLTCRSIITFLLVLGITLIGTNFQYLLYIWCLVAVAFSLIDLKMLRLVSNAQEDKFFSIMRIFERQSALKALMIYRKYWTVALALMISSLFVYLPNYLLSCLMDVKAAGIFAAISYFLVAGGILVNSVSQAVTPNLAMYLKNDEYVLFSSLIVKMCFVGLSVGVVGFLVAYFLGDFFLALFYTPEIAKYGHVLNWVMAAAAVRYIYIFLGTSLAAIKQFHIQTKIYAFGLGVMFLAGLFLIKENGLLGAGQAMFVATSIELICFLIISRRYWKLSFAQEGKLT